MNSEPTARTGCSFPSFDGTELAYTDAGRGPTVVLLHGFLVDGDLNWWQTGVAEAMVECGYRVVVPDARGHGQSPRSQSAGEDEASHATWSRCCERRGEEAARRVRNDDRADRGERFERREVRLDVVRLVGGHWVVQIRGDRPPAVRFLPEPGRDLTSGAMTLQGREGNDAPGGQGATSPRTVRAAPGSSFRQRLQGSVGPWSPPNPRYGGSAPGTGSHHRGCARNRRVR